MKKQSEMKQIDKVTRELVRMETFANRLEELVYEDPGALKQFSDRCNALCATCQMLSCSESYKIKVSKLMGKIAQAVVAKDEWNAGEAGAVLVRTVSSAVHEVRYK